MFQVIQEADTDRDEVEYLYDLCFAPGREALSSYRLREGVGSVAELCLIVRDDFGVLAAAIRYWPVVVGNARHDALLLGPVAVHPTYQGEGLGALLVSESLTRAKALGWARVILVGDAPYYQRFGFEKADMLEFPPPTNPERLLCQALEDGAFDEVNGLIGSVLS